MAQALGTATEGDLGQSSWTSRVRLGSGAAWVLVLIGIPVLLIGVIGSGMIDLQVYRTGGLAWVEGLPLYAKDFPGSLPGPRLPFTYPPIAAVLFGGLALMPWWLSQVLICLGTFLALSGTCLAVAAKLNRRPGLTPSIAAAAAIVAVLSEPVRSTLDYGQINMLLMVLVAADCLAVRHRWLRGVMVGLAAAIKLTPAVFVLYFLVRRDWRAAITTIVSFVFFGLLGLVLAPKDTMDYWFGALLDPSRVGGLAFASNQSLRGVLHRINPPATVELALWALLALGVVVLAVLAARRAVKAGHDVGALIAIAAAGLLISPVSWSHHWVWVAPAMLMVGWSIWRARAWRYLWVWLLAGAVFCLGPFGWLPKEQDREMTWNLWQHLLGDSYVWLAVVLLVVMAFCWHYEAKSDPAPVFGDEESVEVAPTGSI
jgi:alpha-1,2-mannosyltransferase